MDKDIFNLPIDEIQHNIKLRYISMMTHLYNFKKLEQELIVDRFIDFKAGLIYGDINIDFAENAYKFIEYVDCIVIGCQEFEEILKLTNSLLARSDITEELEMMAKEVLNAKHNRGIVNLFKEKDRITQNPKIQELYQECKEALEEADEMDTPEDFNQENNDN
jgi:hypothetical protein